MNFRANSETMLTLGDQTEPLRRRPYADNKSNSPQGIRLCLLAEVDRPKAGKNARAVAKDTPGLGDPRSRSAVRSCPNAVRSS